MEILCNFKTVAWKEAKWSNNLKGIFFPVILFTFNKTQKTCFFLNSKKKCYKSQQMHQASWCSQLWKYVVLSTVSYGPKYVVFFDFSVCDSSLYI